MQTERPAYNVWWRAVALAAVSALGLLGIVGSGGVSVDAPECSFFSNSCNPVIGPIDPVAIASVAPARLSVQAGSTAVFTASSNVAAASYQWQRSTDGGQNFVDIAGATSPAHTLNNVQLSDDAVVLRVRVQGAGATAAVATGRLAVSPLPGVVHEDGDFQPAGWVVTAIAEPAQGGPTHTQERLAAAGNPGAYRSMVHVMTAGPSALRVFHASLASSYDPASQGAVNVIDYREDCVRQGTGTSARSVQTTPLLEQGGRRYVARVVALCTMQSWSSATGLSSLGVADFVQVDGPVCPAGAACPDFAATAAVLRFGFTRRVDLSAGQAAGTVVHGLDNWKVTVWRR